jgi:D-alanyl-D-alanine carboxypeptidase (penicillin-binding protein 5/6)
VTLLLPAVTGESLAAEARFEGPVAAPVDAGQPLGELVVTIEGFEPRHVPLVAETAVAKGGFLTRLGAAAEALMLQFAGEAATLN